RHPPTPTSFPYTTLFRSACGHDFFQVSEAEPKPEIPPDTQNYDVGFKMSSFEQRWPVPMHQPRAYQTVSPFLQHFHLEGGDTLRSEEHTSELQSPYDLVC